MCSDIINSIGFESQYIDNISCTSPNSTGNSTSKGEGKNEGKKEKDLAACKFLKLLDFANRPFLI